MSSMKQYFIDNFTMHFPLVARNAVDWEECSTFGLIITMNDGSHVFYNDIDNSIRNLPDDREHMSEIEFRRVFSDRLYNLLIRKHMTQNDLAELTGIPQPAISSYINGRRTPSFFTIDKIAKALGCSVDEFRWC